jgi:hypothetical protein
MAKKNEFKPDKPHSGVWEKLLLTKLQRKAFLKWTLYALVLVVLSVVQDVLLSRVRLLGATTELVPCGIFLVCLLEGADRGSIFVLVASMLYYFSGTGEGVYVILFITAVAIGATWVRQRFLQSGFGAAMVCTAAAMVVYRLAMYAIGTFLGLTTLSSIGSFLLTAIMTMIPAPVIYLVLCAIGGGDIWKE